MHSQKVSGFIFSSFRRRPESSDFSRFHKFWTPVFTGETTFCESILSDVLGNETGMPYVSPFQKVQLQKSLSFMISHGSFESIMIDNHGIFKTANERILLPADIHHRKQGFFDGGK
jgi:hypothetical protein